MSDPWEAIRATADGPAQAIRWACVLEATAPKVGNVFPGRPFDDLTHAGLLQAAEAAAEWLPRPDLPLGTRIRRAVEAGVGRTGTNANLGILLLLGPLVAGEGQIRGGPGLEGGPGLDHGPGPDHGPDPGGDAGLSGDPGLGHEAWRDGVVRVLGGLGPEDGAEVIRAIRAAGAGGLGEVDEMDVHDPASEIDTDLLAAMRSAADRDRIARQYACGFADLFRHVVPLVDGAIRERGDVLGGIGLAQLRLLAGEPDTLIARRHGLGVALEVQRQAMGVDPNDAAAVWAWDRQLRGFRPRRNPGTTADLIAAALYVLIRIPSIPGPSIVGPSMPGPDGTD